MQLVPLTSMLTKAKEEKYAVGHFNLINLEFTQAIAEVAHEERSPVIFGVGEATIRYMGLDYVSAIAKTAARRIDVPVALHLDHGSSFEVVIQCIRAGFSSVMFDGSHYPLEENIRLTRKVVEAAHAAGVSVEGELGTIGGTEDDRTVEESALVSPEEAISFWNETKVDALAIAVGTAHGLYKSEPRIRCDIISKVSAAIKAPIVLHGGSGVPDSAIQEAIRAGVGKINVNTENQVAFTGQVRTLLNENSELFDARGYLGPARAAVKDVVREKIRLFGSNGKY
ncbi:class II fructose-1,6-bisphosphate aldolase [Paenibacillus hamazuiensis]|uniref:class II fructose-1,6-bisphosphate aldolase n=1 Tax=Paenibacillus hamazuiensis TaxID=2936508 RepID=UPI00200DEBE5|nr:class II fructose-1,6-bisphosphate aldolase [Paenibacillus hamazuiensis]